MKRKLNQAGDTLVEVLIAMSIIGLILGGGYVLTHRNLIAERQAQERGVGLQLVQSQLETLKSSIATLSLPPVGTPFCILQVPQPPLPPQFVVQTDLTKCVFNDSGVPDPAASPAYKLKITEQIPPISAFQAEGNWDQLGGGIENVTVLYRVYKT